MRKHASNILLICSILLLWACKDEDYHYPDLLTDMVEIDTDNSRNIKLLRSDDGKEYSLSKKALLEDGTPDSTYRVRCRFCIDDERTVTLYGLSILQSPHPELPAHFNDSILVDPVKITSVWKSGNYINLHLGVMTKQEKTQKLHFVKTELQPAANGKQRIDLTLFHNQNNDPEAFTKEVFMSCPLQSLDLEDGDSIYMHITTYEGLKTYGFVK